MKKLRCKYHVNINEGLEGVTNLHGMRAYGLIWLSLPYLLKFPAIFWHQIMCPDNPSLHELSNTIILYDPNWYQKRLKLIAKNIEQLVIVKKKVEVLMP